MKKTLIVLGMVFLTYGGTNAQTLVYTDSSLQALDKGQLVDIYISQVNQLVEKLPYSVWGLMSNTSKLDVPKSNYIARKRKGLGNDASKYVNTNKELMYEVVYYADKPALVNAILYLQKTNVDISNVK